MTLAGQFRLDLGDRSRLRERFFGAARTILARR
ncbi:isopropylmalate isomerase [Sedimentitalea arenosa]|nr:isopropylmalate isomerase [Arenibacterium arenosum]